MAEKMAEISQDMSKPTEIKVSTSQLVSKEDLLECFRQKTNDTTEPIALMSRYNSKPPLKDLVDKELYSRSLLQLAGIRGWSDVCEILINDHDCDPFYEDANKWTVLHNVCRNGHFDLVRYFVSTFKMMKQLIHKKNKDGTTPLGFSILYHHTNITEYLENIIIEDPYYIKAIAEGNGYLRSAVVVMHGPPCAGKTSVKQLFLGREPLSQEKQNSTDIIERPIRIRTIKSDGNNKLNEINKPTFHKMLLRSILDNSDDIQKNTEAPVSSQPSTSTAVHSSHQQSGTTTISQSDTPFVNPPSTSLVHLKNPEQPLKINSSRTLKLMKQYLLTAKSSKNVFNFDWIYMVDSGGQPQFSDVLPLLFRSEALYIVVIRLDQDLDVKQNNCYYSNGKQNLLQEKLLSTNRQMIERTCQIAEAQNSEASPRRVIVIATHVDKVSNPEERVKQFDNEIKKIQTNYDKVFVAKDISSNRIIYPVNAMATGDERNRYIKELQQCLINTLKESIKQKKVPLKWFVYQLDLDEESNNTHGIVRKSKCVELGVNLGMSPEEIERSLKFFNTLALHIYHSDFPDMVLIKVDPLIRRLSALIRISFDPPKSKVTYEYTKLKQSGLFNKSLLSTTFANIGDANAISVDDFLCISECLKVIVCVTNDEYFIPSVLSVDSTLDSIKYQLIPCIINWDDHIVLHCFFLTLIVMLLRQKDQKSSRNVFTLPLKKQNVSQSRNRIELDAELHGGVLTLTNEIRWIGIYYSRDNMECYLKILNIVRQALVEDVIFLSKVLGKLQFTFPSFPCLAIECKDDHQHPAYELQFDSDHFQCSLDSHKEFPVTDNMKRIIKSVKSLPTEVVNDQSDGTLTDQEYTVAMDTDVPHQEKRNHSDHDISEDESGDAAKRHHHDEEENANMLDTRMSSNGKSSDEGHVLTRKRKIENSEDIGTTLMKRNNSDAAIRENKNISRPSDFETNNILHKTPLLKDVFDHLRAHSSNWDDIGRELDVNYNSREELRNMSRTDKSRLEAVLDMWIQGGDDSSTWGQLIEALKVLGFLQVVRRVEEFLETDEAITKYNYTL